MPIKVLIAPVGIKDLIDHCMVSAAILDVGQSRQKLQQM